MKSNQSHLFNLINLHVKEQLLLGTVSSIGIMQGIWWVTESLIVEETGVLLGSVGLGLQDFGVLAGVVVTGLLGGLWSAAYVYRSDLARNLQPTA